MVTLNILNPNGNPTHQYEHPNGHLNGKDSVRKKLSVCGLTIMLISGSISLILGILTTIFPLYNLTFDERAKMTPGMPPFDMWIEPIPEVRLNIYLFTVENPDAFLNGTDKKIKMKEIGPIVYKEHLTHENIVFHENNSTMSYTAVRKIEFLDEANEPGILNRTIILPNFALLGIASYMADASFFVKMGFNIMHRSVNDKLFMNITVYDYMWEYSSPLLLKAKSLVPFMVPIDNTGILHSVYSNFVDRYNVKIGDKHSGADFFQINTVNGRTTVPGFYLENGDCNASIENSTEGVAYGQHIPKDSELLYWRRTICRTVPLYFDSEIQKGDLYAHKYVLPLNVYDREENKETDCYKGYSSKPLPNGLSDVSKCYFDLPFAASNPHFYGHPELLIDTVDGLNPNEKDHGSYIILEPELGIPIDQSAKSQSNIVIPDLVGLHQDYQKFSDLTLPLFWFEYHQRELTPYITKLINFIVNILPTLQYIIPAIFLLIAFFLVPLTIIKCLRLHHLNFNSRSPKSPLSILKTNAHHICFEKEIFLNRYSTSVTATNQSSRPSIVPQIDTDV